MAVKFSSITITCNEADHLDECLKALDFCAEKIVIDLGSSDNSVKIARRHNAKVFYHKKEEIVEKIREYALSLPKNDWVVFMDPDEIFPVEAVKEIKKAIAEDEKIGRIAIKLRNYFLNHPVKFGRWKEYFHNAKVFRKQALQFSGFVHRGIILSRDYKDYYLKKGIIKHYWVDTMEEFYEKHSRYLKHEGESRFMNNWRFSRIKMRFSLFKKFIKWHIKDLGFLDRENGWLLLKLALWYEKNAWLSLKDYQKRFDRKI